MEFVVLGPFGVVGEAGPITLNGAKRRGLLALLAVRTPEPLGLDRIADLLWDGGPTGGARNTIQTYISQLRKSGFDIALRSGGYVLDTSLDAIDAHRFAVLSQAAATELEPRRRLRLLDEALSVWHGEPLAEFAGQAWADDAIRAWERQRVLVLERRVDTLLDLGRHADALVDLERLIVTHSLHERFWAQLIVARYRAGQQADALRAYQQLRELLADELGIDPSPDLVSLERRILEHDPCLAPPIAGESPLGARRDALPDGIVTFLLTDIEGSTELWDVHPRSMSEALLLHEHVVETTVAAHHGQMFKSRGEGDATLSVFTRATDALEGAVALLRALLDQKWPDALTLRTRLALHTGEAQLRGQDYFGGTLNRAARVRGVAAGDQILISNATHDVVADVLPDHVELIELGAHALKGLRRTELLYAVAHPALPRPDPTATPPVPAPFTSSARLDIPSGLQAAEGAMAFAGRTEELGQLLEARQQAATGRRQLVMVSGEPGIGKTRLALEAARLAHEGGALVLYGRCDDDAAAPFQPFTEVIDWYFANAGPDAVLGASPEELARLSLRARERAPVVAGSPATDPDTAQYRLFDAVESWFGALAERQTVVMVLDDMHWASKATLLMLRHLLRTASPTALLVVATYRDTDLDEGHPLVSMLADLGRIPDARRIALSGLDAGDVEGLLEQIVDRPRDSETRELSRALQVETRGNAFFVGEVLRHLVETGALEAGGKATANATRIGIPQGVKAILGERLARLGGTATQVLRSAAVVGPEFDARVTAACCELDDDVVVDALDRTILARLVEDDGRGAYRFSHALVRAALLAELSTARRMRIHQLAASALDEIRPGDFAGLAHHWCEAGLSGDPVRAVEVSRLAATQAIEGAAFDDAVQVLERALALAREATIEPGVQSELLLDFGDARMAAGEIEKARDAYVAATAPTDVGAEIVIRAALSFHGPPRVESFDDRHEPLIRRALALLDPTNEPDTCAQLEAALALRLPESDPRKGDHALRAGALGARSADARTRLEVHKAQFWCHLGPHGDAMTDAVDALRTAKTLGSVSEELAALQLCMIASGQLGGDAAAAQYLERYRQLAADAHLRHFLDFQVGIDARQLILAGDHTGAMALVERALEAMPNEPNTLNWASISAQQMRLTNRHAELAQTLREWITADLIPPVVLTYVESSLALALADSGRTEEAGELFDRIVEADLDRCQPIGSSGRPPALAMLASACAALDDAERAETLLPRLQPWVGQHLQLTLGEYCGPATLSIGRVQRANGRFDDAARSLTRAIAEADAGGAPLMVAAARLELARSLSHTTSAAEHVVRGLLAEVREFAAVNTISTFERHAQAIESGLEVH